MSNQLRALIAGCGYLGARVGALLQERGVRVTATTRSSARAGELAALGFEPALLEMARVEESPIWQERFDFAVYAAAPGRGGDARQVFHDGVLACADKLLEEGRPLPQGFVYISTTGLYAERGGARVDETAPVAPREARLQWVLKAEEALRELAVQRGFPAVVLRPGGLYGPGRSPYRWLRRPEVLARISARRPDAYMNWVRIEDAAQAAVLALERGRPGEVYNIVDREPVQRGEFYGLAARLAGIDPPRFEGTSGAPGGNNAQDDLGKRCSSEKARRELGFSPSYPTYREGLADLAEE